MRKALRKLRALLTVKFHWHACPCGDPWVCCNRDCHGGPGLCPTCDAKEFEQWIEAHERRQRGAA